MTARSLSDTSTTAAGQVGAVLLPPADFKNRRLIQQHDHSWKDPRHRFMQTVSGSFQSSVRTFVQTSVSMHKQQRAVIMEAFSCFHLSKKLLNFKTKHHQTATEVNKDGCRPLTYQSTPYLTSQELQGPSCDLQQPIRFCIIFVF